MSVPFLGMRGTGDWQTNQRPENWREMLLRLYPNGDAPLTAIMSMLSSESTDDPHYHWWSKKLATQRAAITGVFTDTALSVAYVSGGVAGDTLYVRMAADSIDQFRLGHQVLLRVSVDPTVDVVAKVTARAKNGASSYLGVYLLEDDDNSSSYDLSDTDVIWIVGNINPEGSTRPSSIMYDPVEYYNYTQIYRTTLEHTRTATKTMLRTGDQVKEAKREALELHGIEIDKSFIFGKRTLGVGSNGKPERTTGGILSFVSTHRYDFPTTSYTWLTDGEDWFDERLEALFRFGSNEKLALCGSGALLAINKLIKASGRATWEMSSMEGAYGINVMRWVTPFGTLVMKSHPLFTYEATMRYNMLIVDTANISYRYIDDTKYIPNIQENDLDGEASEYKTEAGLELHHEETFAYITGLGLNTWGTLTSTPPTTTAPTTSAATTVAPTTTAPTTL